MAQHPNNIDMSVIQAAIDRRRAGGFTPQLEQQTGAAAGPGADQPPVPTEGGPDQASLEQRAGGATLPTEGAPTTPETTEEDAAETRLIAKLLIERLRKLL